MPMKFRYKAIPMGSGVYFNRPVIPIKIGPAEDAISTGIFALIDSGADECIFSPDVANAIGIMDLTTGTKKYVGGVVAGVREEYFVHDVWISVGGWSCQISVGFMPKLSDLGYGILGQKGFFENFSVKFTLPKGEIELKKI